MNKDTDIVEVSFLHNGKVFETQTTQRKFATAIGERLVASYAPLISGTYMVKETKRTTASVVPLHSPKAKQTKKSAPIKRVSHHFEIVI
jgi:hypothetical protein